MDLSREDLLTPKGRLNAAALWPEKDGGFDQAAVNARLDAYLEEAEQKVADLEQADQSEPARHWCYYRAYSEVYERLLLLPSTVDSVGEGSASYLLTQIEHVGELAAAELAAFLELVPVETDETVESVPIVRQSASVPIRFAF